MRIAKIVVLVATFLLCGMVVKHWLASPKPEPVRTGPGDAVVQASTRAEFDKIVQGVKGPVLVDFYADWCPPCRELGPAIAEVAREQAGKLTVVKVNVDNAHDLATQYQVQGIPHLVLLRDGQPVSTQTGFVPKDELMTWLEPYLTDTRK